MKERNIFLILNLLVISNVFEINKISGEFIHPGLLHTTADLNRMKSMVAAEKQPWYTAFQSFSADFHSLLNYTMQGPDAIVTRDTHPGKTTPGTGHIAHDSVAALQLALMYSITGNESYAALSTRILEAWTDTLIIINGMFI